MLSIYLPLSYPLISLVNSFSNSQSIILTADLPIRKLDTEEHSGLDPDLGRGQADRILAQVQRLVAAQHERVETGEFKAALLQEFGYQGSDCFARAGGHDCCCFVWQDKSKTNLCSVQESKGIRK